MHRHQRCPPHRPGDDPPGRHKGGDILSQVKANQPTLLRLITRCDWANAVAEHITHDVAHGRHETRRARLIRIAGTGTGRGQLPWPQVTAAIRIDRTRRSSRTATAQGGTSTETAYFITTRTITDHQHELRLLAGACRAHWAIENRLHWIRDVVYGEDGSLRRVGNLPVVCAACFSLAIAIAHRLGGSHADARDRLARDRRLVGAMLGVRLV
jgi:predicted transposase YbfD/YdcC